MNTTGSSSNLDCLRSAAILAVLFDHFSRQMGYQIYGSIGRSGVLLFFVHTALVLMFSLERLQSRGTATIPFYIQRFFRIMPLCWVCIAVILAFHIPPHHIGAEYRWLGWTWVLENVFLIQNFTFASFVSGPLWSLPYEVQMYVALPFIYVLARRRSALLSISAVWILSALADIALTRVYISLYGLNYDDSLHSPVTHFVPCFLGGVFAFVLSRRKHLELPAVLLFPAIGAFIWLIFQFPFRHADWIGCTALGALLPQLTEIRSRVVQVISHNIAKYSYGVYLAHSPLLWVVFRHFSGPAGWVILCLLLVAIPVACYRWIEKPMIDVGHRIARRLAGARHFNRIAC